MSRLPRETLRLSLTCSNRCIFCAQSGLPPDEPTLAAIGEKLRALRKRAEEISFVGGEPTLHPQLLHAIANARELGYRAVGIQTNGRRLAYPAYARALASAGLTDVHVSIHGAEARTHDYHTGAEASFAQLRAGIAAARANRLTVVATTVLTRSNARVLDRMPRLLATAGVSAWLVAVPRVAGRVGANFDRVAPRLALALSFVLHALAVSRRVGLPAWIQGAPLCLLGTHAGFSCPDAPRAFGAPCEACPARRRCPGVDPVYLERFGGDELRTLPEDPIPREIEPALARMFVGVGELAPPEGVGFGGRAPQPGTPFPGGDCGSGGRSRSSAATSQGGSGTSSSS